MAQVFLKQFRDAGDGTRACYQAVVEAPVRIGQVSTLPAQSDHRIRVHPLDSHPIGQELGLADQQAEVSFEVEIDFIVEDGVEVGRVAAVPGAAATAAYAADGGGNGGGACLGAPRAGSGGRSPRSSGPRSGACDDPEPRPRSVTGSGASGPCDRAAVGVGLGARRAGRAGLRAAQLERRRGG